MGSSLQIEFLASVPQQLQPAAISVKLIRRQDGLVCLDTSTAAVSETETIRVTADIERLDLSPGPYAFDVGLFSESWDTTYDFHKGAYELQITGKGPSGAVWAPPVGWTVRGPSSDRGADSRPHRRARPEPE